MRKYRNVAHPDWLKEALENFVRTSEMYRAGMFPSCIEFFMIQTAIHRLHRSCFKTRWHMLWFLLGSAIKADGEKLYGVWYRFWRYRIQGKSPDADWHRMMTWMCPRCKERHDIPEVSDDIYCCTGCHHEMDFFELANAQPEGDDE